MDNDLSNERCDVSNDTVSVDLLNKRIENQQIDKLYDNAGNLESPDTCIDVAIYQRTCDERKGMSFECNPKYCSKECRNYDIRKNVWKNVLVGASKIDRKGLFANESIKKDEYIIEYLGLETKDKPEQCEDNKYIMKMKNHYIDARHKGSLAWYINQSRETNAIFIKRIVDGSERCGVFAKQDIPQGMEITCHYG